MRHINAGILMFRILGGILLLISAFTAFQRFMSLGAVKESGSITSGAFYISYFMPVVFMAVGAVVCFIIAAILKKKQ